MEVIRSDYHPCGRNSQKKVRLKTLHDVTVRGRLARSTSETVEKSFSIVNAPFFGVSRPFIIMRSLIVAHSVKPFFSASHPRICLGTFSTVSLVIANSQVIFQLKIGAILSISSKFSLSLFIQNKESPLAPVTK